MTRTVILLDPDMEHSRVLCSALEKERFQTVAVPSVGAIQESLKEKSFLVLIIDLDLLTWDNRSLRDLRDQSKGLCIIELSSRPFHPELKEALSRYVDACFSKPVEMDHLLYWLRGVCQNSDQVPSETFETNKAT